MTYEATRVSAVRMQELLSRLPVGSHVCFHGCSSKPKKSDDVETPHEEKENPENRKD